MRLQKKFSFTIQIRKPQNYPIFTIFNVYFNILHEKKQRYIVNTKRVSFYYLQLVYIDISLVIIAISSC
jgi:hypothetical protein